MLIWTKSLADKRRAANRAEQLLSDYELFAERPIDPPVPVEHIIERYLGFTLNMTTLNKHLLERYPGCNLFARKTHCH